MTLIYYLFKQFKTKQKLIMGLRMILIFIGIFFNLSLFAQSEVNFDENAIDPYVLPELFTLSNGQKILSVEGWEKKKRKEILELFEREMYGKLPRMELNPASVEIKEQNDSALNGKAIRKQIALIFSKEDKKLIVNILMYLPRDVKFPPVFVGYNFKGNQSIIDDPNIILTDSWMSNSADFGIIENRATEQSRGKRNNRWPIEKIISGGFAVATVYYGDIDPDRNDFSDGIHPFFYEEGQEEPKNDEWGSISAWAWGLSRVLDCLKEDSLMINSKFILFGHSRLGKTSLWAGALDSRFDMVISNDSGSGGAAISRRNYGETVEIINNSFPHWFSKNFKKYSSKVDSLPIDQHMLIALIAPRPVYIASAQDDNWADPKGEYLAGYHATPIFELYGKEGLTNPEPPETNMPIHNTIGYHVRTGGHDVKEYDWEQFMKFAKKHLSK